MNITQALNAAADGIEQNPASYAFFEGGVPREGERGCMLGHFGRVAGLPVGLSVDTIALAVLGTPASKFYEEIFAASESQLQIDETMHAKGIIPAAMRKVAKKYEGIPEDVREIFASKHAGSPFPAMSAEFYIYLAGGEFKRRVVNRVYSINTDSYA